MVPFLLIAPEQNVSVGNRIYRITPLLGLEAVQAQDLIDGTTTNSQSVILRQLQIQLKRRRQRAAPIFLRSARNTGRKLGGVSRSFSRCLRFH
jgi:hypothetical protein